MRLLLLLTLIACSSAAHQDIAPKYQRKQWRHWTDKDKNCLNTRHEILKARSLGPVRMNKRGCSVKFGKWNDYYYPEVLQEARLIDIDHLVPLKHAHDAGGYRWSKKRKEEFANDPENLVITNRKYNRQKGHQGIDTWLPLHKDYACKYMRDWMKIKRKYSLAIKEAELNAVKGCP